MLEGVWNLPRQWAMISNLSDPKKILASPSTWQTVKGNPNPCEDKEEGQERDNVRGGLSNKNNNIQLLF